MAQRSLKNSGFTVQAFNKKPHYQSIVIDIVIVAIEKDLATLPHVISSAKEFILHPIGDVFIVSPRSKAITELCAATGCISIDEESILNTRLEDINFHVLGLDRSGWIFQQLLKLSVDKISDKRYALVVDADTVFVSPQVFVRDGKIVLNTSDERHEPYSKMIRVLTGKNAFNVSFVCHHILFDREILSELKENISQRMGMHWESCILDSMDRSLISPFSEYELYGNYILNELDSDEFVLEYWYNRSVSIDMLGNLEQLTKMSTGKFKTLSFHTHF